MSSILGIYHRDGKPAAHDALVPPLDALKHNVYDRISTWTDGSISFAHMMLAITPEEKEEVLPLTIDGCTITADARIDNRDELFDACDIPPSERESISDNLIILRAYQTWGKDCPQHLIGDYAFAIWDSSQQHIFCARDHIGVKPFYYYLSQDVFAFASDLRALTAFEDVPVEIDETEIGRYLISLETTYTNNTRTFLKDTYKLPFAHWLTLDNQQIALKRYWTPTDQPESRLQTLDDYADQMFELAQQAVSARLRTDFPVGSHMSGGIDSSSIAVIAAQLLRKQARQINVFSWSPAPTGDIAETEHRRIDAICRQEGLTPIYTERTPADSARVGSADIVMTPVHAMAMETSVQHTAAKLGIRLMLSGWGGDETISFNGRGLPVDWITNGQWGELIRYLGIHEIFRHPRSARRSVRRGWENLILPLLPDAVYVRLRRKQLTFSNPFINPAFELRIRNRIGKLTPPARTLAGVHATQFRLYMHGHMTARLESWAAFGAEQGITYAFPLLDRRLMEFAYRLPSQFYLQNGIDRYLFRYTMNRILPDGVAWDRVKEDVSLQRRAGTLAPETAELERKRWLENEQLNQPNPWVNVNHLRTILLDRITSQDWSRDFTSVLVALNCLAIWQRWNGSQQD